MRNVATSPGKALKEDLRLALGYGSAWHLLRCLGWQRERFTTQIAGEIGASSIAWLDFPRYVGGQSYRGGAPIRDGEWEGLAFVDDPHIRKAYGGFWPGTKPPNWDLIGKAVIEGNTEWLLVEAKAYPKEIRSDGTTAKESGGRPRIRFAFKETLQALGYDAKSAASLAEQWLTGYYQHANRVATLHFSTKNNVAARLLFLYFCGDQDKDGTPRPAMEEEWAATLERVHEGLGLRGATLLERRMHNIFVPVDLASGVRTAAMG